MNSEPAWPGGEAGAPVAGKRKDAGSTPCFGSPFCTKTAIYGHCLVTALDAQLMKQ